MSEDEYKRIGNEINNLNKKLDDDEEEEESDNDNEKDNEENNKNALYPFLLWVFILKDLISFCSYLS